MEKDTIQSLEMDIECFQKNFPNDANSKLSLEFQIDFFTFNDIHTWSYKEEYGPNNNYYRLYHNSFIYEG